MTEIFRLRNDDQILGYTKKIYSNTFYSKDLYGWSGKPIKGWIQQDINTDLRDKNNQLIFEEDIILAQYNSGAKIYIHVVYDPELDHFLFFNFKTGDIVYKGLEVFSENFSREQLHRVSYSFLN